MATGTKLTVRFSCRGDDPALAWGSRGAGLVQTGDSLTAWGACTSLRPGRETLLALSEGG